MKSKERTWSFLGVSKNTGSSRKDFLVTSRGRPCVAGVELKLLSDTVIKHNRYINLIFLDISYIWIAMRGNVLGM